MAYALALPDENPMPTIGWLLVGTGVAVGVGYAVSRWLRQEDASAPGLFVPEGPPDDVVFSAFAKNPTASLMLLTDQIYADYYPECPAVIDPNSPQHKPCAGKWVATRRAVSRVRDNAIPPNMILITDALERELKWPEFLSRQDDPMIGVGYYADVMAKEVYDAVVSAAKDNPGVVFLMMENSTALSHGGMGVAEICPGSGAFIMAAPSYRSNMSSFEACIPFGDGMQDVLAQLVQAASILSPCDPLNPNCPPGYGCFSVGARFACLPLDEDARGIVQNIVG